MEIYILTPEIEVIGVVSTYEAIIWTNKMYEPGSFKATFVFSEKMNQLLQCENLLYKEDEPEPGIITRKYIKLNKQGEQTIQVQGFMASRYLTRRIVWSKTILKGTPEEAMRQLVYQQVIAPVNADRQMPLIFLGELKGYEGEINKQVTYENLQETLTAIAKTNELGYRLSLDVAQKRFYFDVFRGEKRTAGSSHPCIFSRDFQNVYIQEYSEDRSNCRNVCLVGGMGEDEDRALAIVGEGIGLDRFEMFYNVSGLLDADATDNELKILRQKGAEKLNSYVMARSFEVKVNKAKAMPHELGDYVTCTDEQWGITMETQITAIERGYSKTEESYVVTLGKQVPTLIELIKAKE